MTREDFIFTIGFDGNSAVVDKKSKKQYGKLNTVQLLELGFIKPAVCSALFSGEEDEQLMVLKKFNEKSERKVERFTQLLSFFGVPDSININCQVESV